MRVENAEITIKMPLPIDKPDRNGIVFSKEAIEEGLKTAKNAPLQVIQNNDETVVIGTVCDIDYIKDSNGDYAMVRANLRYGGTCEEVDRVDRVVTAMRITGVGIATS